MSGRECESRASASANQVEALVLDRLAREITGMRGNAGDVLTPALEEQERAQVALEKLRKVAALADDLEGLAAQIKEAKARVERADAAVDDARAATGVTWRLSSIFHGLPGDPDFREEPSFEGMSAEQLRDLLQTVFAEIKVAAARTGSPWPTASPSSSTTFSMFSACSTPPRASGPRSSVISTAGEDQRHGSSLREVAAG